MRFLIRILDRLLGFQYCFSFVNIVFAAFCTWVTIYENDQTVADIFSKARIWQDELRFDVLRCSCVRTV